MYNIIDDPFFPIKDKKGVVRKVPLREILLGNLSSAEPVHPDPAIQGFYRYFPSLVLQVLDVELDQDEWIELVSEGRNSDAFSDWQETIGEKLDEQLDFFTIHPDKNGFYQHYDVKTEALSGTKTESREKIGMDGLLIHSVSGNNICHHKRPDILKNLCPACALMGLIHHNNFTPAGLAGPSNLRGNQALFCMIKEDDYFRRMIANTYFPIPEIKFVTGQQTWPEDLDNDQPSWIQPGRKVKKGYEYQTGEVGLKRAVLFTPRHAFFDVEEKSGTCDLCELESDLLVEKYYWRVGEDKKGFISHPAMATYLDEKQGIFLPQNYSDSLWRMLGGLGMKKLDGKDKSFKAAPLISQYKTIMEEALSSGQFTMELQAYQTDKAKLEGFHHQFIELPLFERDKYQDLEERENAEHQFYEILKHYTNAIAELLSAFSFFGKADKKREKEQIPRLQDCHQELTQTWGEEVLNSLLNFRNCLEEKGTETLIEKMGIQLDEYSKTLRDEFSKLTESYADDDLSAQRKILQQRRMLGGRLKKIRNDFKENEGVTS